MADEITYDRVEDAEQAILEAISGVGDTVNGLPASLETDFTEVKNAIADVKTDVGNVNTAVSNVKIDTSSIKNTVDTNPLLSAGSVVKSVQRGYLTSINSSGGKVVEIAKINSVDIDKSILLINNLYSYSSSLYTACFFLSDPTTISCYLEKSIYYPSVAWQVIEFY